MLLYIKYESPGPCSFREEIFDNCILKKLFFLPRDLLMQPIRYI